jgi:hypothetical protein
LTAPVVASRRKELTALKNVVLFAVLAAMATALVPQATARHHAAKAVRTEKAVRAVKRASLVESTALLRRIERHRNETWRWQRVMQRPRTPYGGSAHKATSLVYRRWAVGLWLHRATLARKQAVRPPHKTQWLCIHRYEGSWTDPNSPYYGGLQMDVEFQRTYGRELYRSKGTADKWTPLEQMWVAERAFRARGFSPWPNTARYCGLL